MPVQAGGAGGARIPVGAGKAGGGGAVCTPAMFTPAYIDQHCRDARGEYVGDRKCTPFAEPRRYDGLVVLSFETMRFYPGARTLADADPRGEAIWFSSDVTQDAFAGQDSAKCGPDMRCAFAMTVIGRSSLCRGGYGHENQYPHELLVEKVERTRQIDLGKPKR